MPTLHIEHAVHDFDTWKAAFDRDPARRAESGVRRYEIHRPADDQHYVLVDLDFDTTQQAEAFLQTMRGVWRSAHAAPALKGEVRTRVLETVEVTEL